MMASNYFSFSLMDKKQTQEFTSYFKGIEKSKLEQVCETIFKEEAQIIEQLAKQHQIVDAQKLLTLLHKRAALRDVIDGRVSA